MEDNLLPFFKQQVVGQVCCNICDLALLRCLPFQRLAPPSCWWCRSWCRFGLATLPSI